MLGLLISVTLALLVVGTSISAMRRGEIDIGERHLDRRQLAFWVLTGGGALMGAAILAVSVRAYWEVQQDANRPPQVLERDGVAVTVPGSWTPIPEIEELMGGTGGRVLAVGGEGAELVVLWPPGRPASATNDLRAMAEVLHDPALSYERWELFEDEHGVRIDATYPSPRGLVVARHLIFDEGGQARVVTATCNTEGELAACQRAVSTLARTR